MHPCTCVNALWALKPVVDRTPGSSRKFMTPNSVSTHAFGQKNGRGRGPAAIETEPNGGKHGLQLAKFS
jgi:hypothetical protein